MKACPRPGCAAVAFAAFPPSDTYTDVACSCGSKWCFNCSAEDHRPANCAQVKKWEDKGADQDLTAMYIRANTKKCPMCALEITKDEGCAHMKCSQCGHHFCWLCLGPYAQHNESTGGFYACNKFESRVKAEGRTDEEKTALRAARSLKNYEMAFERHLNHKSAQETAQKELLLQVEQKLKDMAEDGVEDSHQL